MDIRKTLSGVASASAVALFATVPEVTSVTMDQDAPSRLVTVTYQLDSTPAVVTLDIQTNEVANAATGWTSIGGKHICDAEGAVWRKVTAGDLVDGKFTITWHPDQSWTDANGNGFKVAAGKARAVVTAWPMDNTPDYMVVDISAAAQPNTQKYYPSADFLPGGLLSNQNYRTTKLVMRKILAKGVEWTMGATSAEDYNADREATHQVVLTNNYYIGIFPVTQAQWGVVATNSQARAYYSYRDAVMRPMEYVCYNEIRLASSSELRSAATSLNVPTSGLAAHSWPKNPSSASFLGLIRAKTGLDFDLPSEAQWEFAARAGNGVGFWGDGSAIKNSNPDVNLDLLGRYKSNGGTFADGSYPSQTCYATNGTAVVGTYAPNAWGIYDMHGNVYELCLDWFETNIATATDESGDLYGGRVNISPTDPSCVLSGGSAPTTRTMRGGCWYSGSKGCRSASRGARDTDLRHFDAGFRLVCRGGLQ